MTQAQRLSELDTTTNALQDRIAMLERQQDRTEYTLSGNGAIGVISRLSMVEDRLETLERRLHRIMYILLATLAAAMAGGIDGVMRIVSLVVEQL